MWLDLATIQNDIVSFCANWTPEHITPQLSWFTHREEDELTEQVEPQAGAGEPFYRLIEEIDKPIPKFMRRERRLKYEFINGKFESYFDVEQQCKSFFDELFEKYVAPIAIGNQVRFYIRHSMFQDDINLPAMYKNQITPAIVYKSFYDTFQSRKKTGLFLV